MKCYYHESEEAIATRKSLDYEGKRVPICRYCVTFYKRKHTGRKALQLDIKPYTPEDKDNLICSM
jgi:hypothetical protein